MVLKLVYYGPALSGKTTNLLRLHDELKGDNRGQLMTLDTKDDRTIYFDLLPFFMEAPSGLKIKVKLFTVPGQVRHDATRKAVLQRADGVAFIADSQLNERSNNAASFANLEQNLSLVGLDIDEMPLVIQYNKRDLPAVIDEEEIRQTWRPTGFPVQLAAAINGRGVVETFSDLCRLTYEQIDRRCHLQTEHGLGAAAFIGKLRGDVP